MKVRSEGGSGRGGAHQATGDVHLCPSDRGVETGGADHTVEVDGLDGVEVHDADVRQPGCCEPLGDVQADAADTDHKDSEPADRRLRGRPPGGDRPLLRRGRSWAPAGGVVPRYLQRRADNTDRLRPHRLGLVEPEARGPGVVAATEGHAHEGARRDGPCHPFVVGFRLVVGSAEALPVPAPWMRVQQHQAVPKRLRFAGCTENVTAGERGGAVHLAFPGLREDDRLHQRRRTFLPRGRDVGRDEDVFLAVLAEEVLPHRLSDVGWDGDGVPHQAACAIAIDSTPRTCCSQARAGGIVMDVRANSRECRFHRAGSRSCRRSSART